MSLLFGSTTILKSAFWLSALFTRQILLPAVYQLCCFLKYSIRCTLKELEFTNPLKEDLQTTNFVKMKPLGKQLQTGMCRISVALTPWLVNMFDVVSSDISWVIKVTLTLNITLGQEGTGRTTGVPWENVSYWGGKKVLSSSFLVLLLSLILVKRIVKYLQEVIKLGREDSARTH